MDEKAFSSYVKRCEASRGCCKRYYEKNIEKIRENNRKRYYERKTERGESGNPRKKSAIFPLKYEKYRFDNGKRYGGDSLTVYVQDRRADGDNRPVRLQIEQVDPVEFVRGVYNLIQFVKFEVLESEYVVHVQSKASADIKINFELTERKIKTTIKPIE